QNNMSILREKTALVEQEPFLFNDTIYKNVAFGNRYAGREEVVDALKKAHVWEFVSGLKEKENTMIEERGNNLSVGQKQRIAIARALIRKPTILVLDEATSNIDNISEKYISDTINQISSNLIVFIVAHKLNTIADCDRIIVINDGIIIEEGVHEELLGKEGGVYAQQYNQRS
ncbi:MAG TPA: ATP-binding cassette domain-containing protein, partial [Firmicutes bacterium]|nr:ATP-binding cassette domain-containing protein [Bacillota bacterium]